MNKKFMLLSLIIMVSLNVGCNSQNTNKTASGNITNSSNNEESKSKWNTYNNERFEFSIKYPENFGYDESENGDGITFLTGDEDVNISVYASHSIDDPSRYKEIENEYNLKEDKTELNNGVEATVLKGSVGSDYHHEVIYINDAAEYHLLSITSVDYYIDNKDMIEEMANSFNPPKDSINNDSTSYKSDEEEILIEENNDNKDKLTANEAIDVYRDFSDRVYITMYTDSDKVSNYNTKSELIDYISEVADKSLAKGYVDYYYSERNDGLYMNAQDKTEEIDFNRPYQFNKLDDSNYEIVQEGDNDFDESDRYILTVRLSYKNNRWIISDKNIEYI